MKFKIIALINLLLFTASLFANSIFSFYGMPVRTYGIDSYGMGMGKSGISDIFRVNTSYLNPSLMSTSSRITISTSASFGFVKYSDNNNSFRDNVLYFPYFTLAVPIKNHKLGFSFNSILAGNLKTQQDFVYTDEDDNTFDYTEIHKIDSNIFETSALYAFKNKFVNLGISGNIYLGHNIKYHKIDFEADYFNDATYEHEEDLKNFGYGLGMNRKVGDFSLALAYKSSSELYGDVINRFNFTPGADTLETNKENLFEIPELYAAGITFRHNVYKISAESVFEKWSNPSFNKTFKYSLGFAYDPVLGYGTWIDNIPARLGVSYSLLPFKVNSEDIYEKTITAGISIPLHIGEKLDVTISYSKRGDKGLNGAQDDSIMMNIGINAFDIFTKRHRRTAPRDIPEKDM